MAKQHIAIFKSLGFDQKDIDAIEAIKEDDKDWKPDATVETIRTGMKKILENDQTFLDSIPEEKIPAAIKKNIEKSQYARFQNELIDVAKKELGLDDKEILTDEDRKSIKVMTSKIAKAYFSKNSNDDAAKKLQKELGESVQLLATKEQEWSEKVKTETAAVEGKFQSKLIKTLLGTNLASLDKIKLHVSPGILTTPVLDKLSSKYSVVIDEQDNLDIKDKINPKLEAMDAKTGKKIPIIDALREIVIAEKLGEEVKEDTGGEGGGKKKVIVDSGGGAGGEGNDAVVLPDYIKESIEQNTIPAGK